MLAGLILLVTVAAAVSGAERAESEWVKPGPDGRLVYKALPAGDRIMDFSHAGYRGGGVALPDVPVKKTVKPSGGEDDSAVIQAAIDEVSQLPLDADGFRGAILLAPGTYPCAETINIRTGGIVLRGSASHGAQRTTIKMTGRPHLAIAVRRRGVRGSRDDVSEQNHLAETTITDAYVPSGSTRFTVASAGGFAPGDAVLIRRPVTKAWIEFMQMHDMVRNDKPQTWLQPGRMLDTERRIAAIDGNTITLDVPLADSYDAAYLNPPGTIVAKIAPPQRIAQSAIEHLHIESPPQEISHSDPHHSAIRLSGEDCWIRDVAIDETMNSIGVGGRRMTLQRVTIHRRARHQGASKPAEIAPNATQVLLDRCDITADNVWYVATGGAFAGPIVVLNCTFRGNGRAESHQRWSTGMLYDNCRAPEGGIEMRNRGSMGSGHGWSMGWGVAWNCTAGFFIVQNPPGAANWMIGCVGESRSSPRPFGSEPDLPGGIVDSPAAPVAPSSLYLAQLLDRLGPQALKNIGYDSTEIDADRAAPPGGAP